MPIHKVSALMERRIRETCGDSLESFHIEHGCCEGSPCLWVYLKPKSGHLFSDMGCGTLHESSAKSVYSVLSSFRKAEEGEG